MTKVYIYFKGKANYYKVITNVYNVWICNELLFVSHVSDGVEVQKVYPLELFDFEIY